MIAHPISQAGVPAPSTPVASAAEHEPASQNRLAENLDKTTPPGPSNPPPPESVLGTKQFSQTKSANDQARAFQSTARIAGQNAPLETIDPRQHTPANAADSCTDASPLDGHNTKKSVDLGSKMAMAELLANEAQAAALSNLLKDRKKRYAPVRPLPPLSSDPAVQALRAAQVQSPTLSATGQGKQVPADAPQVSLEKSLSPEVIGLPGIDGKRKVRGEGNVGTSLGAGLSQNETSSIVTGTANANCSVVTHQGPRQVPTISDCGAGASTTLKSKVKQEGARMMTEKVNCDRDLRSNGAISSIGMTVIEAVDKQTDQRETTGQGTDPDVMGIDRSVVKSPQGNVGDISHSYPDLKLTAATSTGGAPVAKAEDKKCIDNPNPAVAVHGGKRLSAHPDTGANLNSTQSRESSEIDGKRCATKNGKSFPIATKSPSWNPAHAGLTSGAPQPQLKQEPGNSGSAAQPPRNAELAAPIPGITILPSSLHQNKPQHGDNNMGNMPDLVQDVVKRSCLTSFPDVSDAKSKLRSKAMRKDRMKEPLEHCIRLLIRSLCICGTGNGISKEAATKCRQKLRNILKSVPKGVGTVMEQEAALNDPMAQDGFADPKGVSTTGIVSKAKSSSSPSCETTKSVLSPLSHIGLSSPTKMALSQASPAGTVLGEVTSNSLVKAGEELRAADSGSEGKSSVRKTSSSAVNGIQFTFIQWGLSIRSNKAQVEDIASGAREFVDTCNALRSPLPGSLWIREEDLLVHVMNLNAAASTILFLVRKTDSLTEELASRSDDQPSASTQLEHALNALRDILLWVRYLTDRVVELWNKYQESAVCAAEVKSFCEGIQKFIKSSSSENKSDGFLSSLRECKRSFPHAKSLAEDREDDKSFFDRRKNLGEEVRSILPKLGKVCSWCQKQLLTLRLEKSNDSSLDEGLRHDTGAHPKRSKKELERKRPSEQVKDIARVPASLKPIVSGVDISQDESGPRAQKESESQTFRRASVHDPSVPIKRKSKDMGDSSTSTVGVTSGNQNLPRIAIPMKSGQSDMPASGAANASSGAMGRKPVKPGAKNVFDAAAFMKDALGVTGKERRKDDQRPFHGSSKNAPAMPSSTPRQGQAGTLRRSSLPTSGQTEEITGRPLKRRRGQSHNVSFNPQLVVGRRESSIRKEEVSSLFHDGYDLLGCDNAIQERAVRERANQLSRGSMMALFGFLRSEFIRLKDESELRSSLMPEYVNLNYTASATKQVSRQLQVQDSFSKHPAGSMPL